MSEKKVWSRPNRIERKNILRAETDERKKYWDSLTTIQQITALDKRLGPNVGAKKQRIRLKGLLEKEYEAKAKAKEAKAKAKETKTEKAKPNKK